MQSQNSSLKNLQFLNHVRSPKEVDNFVSPQYDKKLDNSNGRSYGINIKRISEKISNSLLEFLDDLFTKPDNIDWFSYLLNILQKNDRFTFFGMFVIVIAIIIALF